VKKKKVRKENKGKTPSLKKTKKNENKKRENKQADDIAHKQ
jgi:hypothetical protein